MYLSSATTIAVFAATVSAKVCINQTVPVTISARQAIFNLAVPQTNSEATNFILNQTRQGGNFTNQVLTGYGTTSGTYNISTQFCMPNSNSTFRNLTNPTVQVLTHGIGFDKTYWDLSYNNYNYSYINNAVDTYGYHTLSFDRLGIANSSHGEPLNEIQSFLEVEATASLTNMLRAGTFPNVTTAFQKVVHVGHSFGSAQSYYLANKYPNITDGIVLTGFSMNSSFVSTFAAGGNFQQAYLNQPLRFSNLTGVQAQSLLNMYAEPLINYLAPISLTNLPPPTPYVPGYLVSSNAEATKLQFFYPGYYDENVLLLAESTKQAVTEGELLTLGSLPMNNSFTGPVLVITGDEDVPYCGGNCSATGGVATSIPAQVVKNFPSAARNTSQFEAYIQRNTGHGINLHYNATGAYNVIGGFLRSRGLASS